MNKLRVLLGVLIFCLAVVNSAFGQNVAKSNPETKLQISDKWSLSHQAYIGKEFENLLVRLVSVNSTLKNGFPTIDKVSLQNRSTKDIVSLKLSWILSDKNDKNKILQQGETSVIPEEISSGTTNLIKFPVVTFANIYKPLKDNSLTGNYQIVVFASEVTFSDETSWKFKQPKQMKMTK